ncbi:MULTISPECIES: hypothetical protein [Pseudonocardia]|uniref:Uncharacterized protein n=2 Tax=Pseudonocardia TaxID=1847 RepID=A0A1Y2MNJ2_PSEAH|nr:MULTISPECIES: hypothetical protein [Pseudonocardia]OSY36247.1 hypothetical protein BG845_05497 [Pseudonocardia autotrophica]TDN73055.1 hypothetical protein C8E95_2126 [Pseudonocardia autotrophica]BBG03773.1 hypothetical protein Pdca_49820 [Pseudonocardia autotrophica]GEC26619.1 hypothetical protein PSA01_36480 [Pseudonocardia saturnea]
MVSIHVGDDAITVRLSAVERLFSGGRAELVVPLAAVCAADYVERPTRASVTGVGQAGLVVTGVVKIGRWGVGSPVSRFVSARRRIPAVRIVVDEDFRRQFGYDELVVSTPDAAAVTAALAVPGDPTQPRGPAAGSPEPGRADGGTGRPGPCRCSSRQGRRPVTWWCR